MIIHKNSVYAGNLNGQSVKVMPVWVDDRDVCFTIGKPFGSKIWFDGSQTDSIRRADFEREFTPMKNDEERL